MLYIVWKIQTYAALNAALCWLKFHTQKSEQMCTESVERAKQCQCVVLFLKRFGSY